MIKFTTIIKNPFVTILPIIVALVLIWQQYTNTELAMNTPQRNVMPNAGFETVDGNNIPTDWKLLPANAEVSANLTTGYGSPKSIAVVNNGTNTSSNTSLTSPNAPVEHSKTYFYKAYYQSTVPFDLLLRVSRADGSHSQTIVRHYPPSDHWTTVNHLFTTDDKAQSVQFAYNFSARGELKLDNTYLEPDPKDVYQAPQPITDKNLVPNPNLVSSDQMNPDGWSSYANGNNRASFGYVTGENIPYLKTDMTNYKNGETKWQYHAVEIRGNQQLRYQVDYATNTSADVVAEYVLESGERQFQTLTTLTAISDWTTYTQDFQAPLGATNILVSVVLRGNGTVKTRHYALYDTTKPGSTSWQRPLVSFTFDNDRESAYTNAASILNQYGYKATYYLSPSSIDTRNFMSSEQVSLLQSQGHELASSGFENLDYSSLDRQSMQYQLEHAYQYFNQTHHKQAVNFATPFGVDDAQVTYYAQKYYTSQRSAESGINTRQNFNPYHLLVSYISSDTPLSTLAKTLTEVKDKGGWLILVYHRIDSDATGEASITPTQFQQQVQTVKASGLTVKPIEGALKEVSPQ